MKIGFTGSRNLSSFQEKKVVKALERLAPDMTYAITGACEGVDAFIAEWIAENTDIQNVIVWPPERYLTVQSLYALPRTVHIEIPKGKHDWKLGYRLRNQKIVELSDQVVAFWNGKLGGTRMTMDIARHAEKLQEVVMI